MLRPSRHRLAAGALVALLASPAVAQSPGALFPEPFAVEHYFLETAPDGERFTTEPVRDTYGGSWIVSERADGSRLILDLARREATEIRPAEGIYWQIGFDRMGELTREVSRLDGLDVLDAERREAEVAKRDAEPAERPELRVEELTGGGIADAATGPRMTKASVPAGAKLDSLRHLRVVAETPAGEARAAKADAPRPWTEVWVDTTLRLTPAAVEALGRFERDALAAGDDPAGPAARLAAARVHADGALPVRVLEPMTKGAAVSAVGTVEDVVTRIERLDAFDATLLRIPEGLRRAPHPLEGMADVLDDEFARRRMLVSMPEHREGGND